jgi:3-oxoacyl-[acyl-carrier protein] reductase
MSVNQNKVALVTGASRGIGAAVAERLGRDGFTVIVNYAGNAALAEELAQKIEKAGGKALTAQADVSDPDAVRRMFDTAETAFGGIDVLVNNAGIMLLSPLAGADDAHFDRQIAVNLRGTFNTLREAAGRLRDGGRVINFSTSVVGLKLETYGVYAATKAAVETLTAIMSKEMRGRNITVNAIAPGPTATDLFLNGKSDELIERRRTSPPPSPSSPARTVPGSTARCCAPMAAWSDPRIRRRPNHSRTGKEQHHEQASHRHHRRFQRLRRPHRPRPAIPSTPRCARRRAATGRRSRPSRPSPGKTASI